MSRYNSNIHHRRSIRLKGYDYSQAGLYFITLSVKNRKSLFGNIFQNDMILNDAGQMVKNEWTALPGRFRDITLHEYIVMPDHFHAILEILAAITTPARKTVGDIVGAFESITTVQYIRGVRNKNWSSFDGKLWQRNYYEHIIRNERSYHNISQYIINNPAKWDGEPLALPGRKDAKTCLP